MVGFALTNRPGNTNASAAPVSTIQVAAVPAIRQVVSGCVSSNSSGSGVSSAFDANVVAATSRARRMICRFG